MSGDDQGRMRSILFVAGGVFIFALVLLLWLGAYGFFGAFFLALLLALVAAAILWFGFGGGIPTGMVGQGDAPTSLKEAEPSVSEQPAASEPATEPTPEPSAKPEQSAPEPEPSIEAEPDAEPGRDYDGDGFLEGKNEGSKPEVLAGPRDGGADDLKQIKGVGPKLEKTINALGFYHFDQIASWSDDEVAWVDANLTGFPGRVSRDNWVEQAKVLASGGETEFSKRVDQGDVY